MRELRISYLNPKCQVDIYEDKGGCGVVAREMIHKDEVVSIWGGGRIVPEKDLDYTMEFFTQRVIQVEEGLFLVGSLPLEPTDCFNHSCEPNSYVNDCIKLFALRDVNAGEELTIDYGTTYISNTQNFKCLCGTESCRGQIGQV